MKRMNSAPLALAIVVASVAAAALLAHTAITNANSGTDKATTDLQGGNGTWGTTTAIWSTTSAGSLTSGAGRSMFFEADA